MIGIENHESLSRSFYRVLLEQGCMQSLSPLLAAAMERETKWATQVTGDITIPYYSKIID